MTPAELVLAGEFPAATRADWQALVDAVLRKSGADSLPVNTTYDGITLAPLYTSADAESWVLRMYPYKFAPEGIFGRVKKRKV